MNKTEYLEHLKNAPEAYVDLIEDIFRGESNAAVSIRTVRMDGEEWTVSKLSIPGSLRGIKTTRTVYLYRGVVFTTHGGAWHGYAQSSPLLSDLLSAVDEDLRDFIF